MENVKYAVETNQFDKTIIIATYDDGRVLSFMADPSNSDYQAYLASLNDTPQG
jgi:hypothetical protein